MDIHQALDDMQQLKRTIEQQATILFRAGALDPDDPALAEVAGMLSRARTNAARTVAILAAALDGMAPRRDFLDAVAASHSALLQLQVLAYDLQAKGLPMAPTLYDGHAVDVPEAGARLRWLAAVAQMLDRLKSTHASFSAAEWGDLSLPSDAGYPELVLLAEGVRALVKKAGVVAAAVPGSEALH